MTVTASPLAQNAKLPPPSSYDPTLATSDTLGFNLNDNRMTVPVSSGSGGPYRFIIDTGAERTVVSSELA
ncbi:MAG: hypothetical protein JSR79_04630, partial [Proteobacteria bacterium]|nr:hypothetical protein [Pseudomonadota bacterium]